MRRVLVALGLATMSSPWAAAQDRPEPAKAAAPANVNTDPLTHEVEIDAPVAKVWDCFATSEGFKNWGPAHAKVDLRIGGKIQSHYNPAGVLGDEGTIENTILAYEPHRMIAFQISKPPKGFPFMNAYHGTWTVATLTDLGQGRTLLRLTGMGYTGDEQSQKMRAFFEQGNAYSLDLLKRKLAGADGSTATPFPNATPNQDPLAPLMVETAVAAMPGEVWKSWTTGNGVKAFLGVDNNIELKIGGPYELYFGAAMPEGSRGSEGCTILSYDPERMLSFSWNAPPKLPHARSHHTWVIVSIAPHGAHASKVTLKHHGFAEQAKAHPDYMEEWKQAREYFSKAWPNVLKALREHHQPKATPGS